MGKGARVGAEQKQGEVRAQPSDFASAFAKAIAREEVKMEIEVVTHLPVHAEEEKAGTRPLTEEDKAAVRKHKLHTMKWGKHGFEYVNEDCGHTWFDESCKSASSNATRR
jgi:hypothetical protein